VLEEAAETRRFRAQKFAEALRKVLFVRLTKAAERMIFYNPSKT